MNSAPTSRIPKNRQPLNAVERNERRRLIFHDTLALLVLTAISILMAVLTYYFFHSFREHRTVLEKRWFARGERAMDANLPQQAVVDFRSALSLSAGNTSYELALAEALAKSNRNEEAFTYFSSLHEATPGDGYLNLQLARLAVKRDESAQAIRYYRAALSGLWYGHGADQRFQIRLELARYLMSQGRATDAQGDLLTAEGNSLDHPAELYEVAGLLEQAGDPADALAAYRRVERHAGATDQQILDSLRSQARVAMSMGQYKQAATALSRYNTVGRQHPAAGTPQQRQAAQQQLAKLHRLLQLIPFDTLPTSEHAERVLLGATAAHTRYAKCSAQIQPQNVSGDDAAALAALATQWSQFGHLNGHQLASDPTLQQNLRAWTNRTEILAARLCGAPAGDDALLLQIAHAPDKSE